MKRTLIKLLDKILIATLTCLGLSQCEIINSRVEYGTPNATYEIKGTVSNIADAKPIKNIRIVRKSRHDFYHDTVTYTDNNGKYYFNFKAFPTIDTIKLQVTDIDGEQNDGEFAEKTINVIFTNADKVEKGDGHWNNGKYSKTQNIQLSQK